MGKGVAVKNRLGALQSQLQAALPKEVEVDVFRHAQAGKAPLDFQRQLTAGGIEQARQLGVAIADVPYHLVVSSPAPRAIHTALIAISESRPSVSARMCFMAGRRLYGPNDDVLLAEIWRHEKKVGSMRYLEYRAADTVGCYDAFQHEALSALLPLVDGETSRVAVFNHAVMGSFLAEAVLGSFKQVTDGDREVLNTECPPCGCFRVTRAGVKFINYLS